MSNRKVKDNKKKNNLFLFSFHILFSCSGAEVKEAANDAVDAAKDSAENAADDLKPVVNDAKEAGMFT